MKEWSAPVKAIYTNIILLFRDLFIIAAVMFSRVGLAKAYTKEDASWGRADNLSEQQQKDLNIFLEKARHEDLLAVKFDVESHTGVALRFLRAREFAVDRALVLLDESIMKKKSEIVDALHDVTADESAQCDVRVLQKFYPHAKLGFDRSNRPILYEKTGAINISAVKTITTMDCLMAYHVWSMEHDLNAMFRQVYEKYEVDKVIDADAEEKREETGAVEKGKGERYIGTCVIVDLEGLTLAHCAPAIIEHLKRMVTHDNTCYPEILGKMFIINAPWIAQQVWKAVPFTPLYTLYTPHIHPLYTPIHPLYTPYTLPIHVQVWKVVKVWLDKRTKKKIEILGSSGSASVQQHLLKHIDKDTLPVTYGGTVPEPNSDLKDSRSFKSAFVTVKERGLVVRTVEVREGEVLTVDTYVTDDDIGLEVTVQYIEPMREGLNEGEGEKEGEEKRKTPDSVTPVSSSPIAPTVLTDIPSIKQFGSSPVSSAPVPTARFTKATRPGPMFIHSSIRVKVAPGLSDQTLASVVTTDNGVAGPGQGQGQRSEGQGQRGDGSDGVQTSEPMSSKLCSSRTDTSRGHPCRLLLEFTDQDEREEVEDMEEREECGEVEVGGKGTRADGGAGASMTGERGTGKGKGTRRYTVTWNNSSKHFKRPLVYALSVRKAEGS